MLPKAESHLITEGVCVCVCVHMGWWTLCDCGEKDACECVSVEMTLIHGMAEGFFF